ncbi:iron-containing alcohol dehydrogenase [Fictibacillus enclensis]|uniref:iron-containing alcohol dehydrogenase n=1 Tax=Fictibacillus enclensis TaxID=1017270 RepID=UPI0025A2B8BF|nr:iron-containing alcohol dehydrogenase [Fictibacillus enclensis]MDM5198254.1 iron-containing alcohol dehydrogenase [Fictibacillus enclensis]
MKKFAEFRMPNVLYYGRDALGKLGDEATGLGTKVLLISDRVMEKIGHVRKCEELIEKQGLPFVSYLDVNTEPTDLHVKEALEICLEEKCNVIVSIGGGSCLDTGKAVAVVAANGGYIGDYRGGAKTISEKPLPFIAIPTTAGTGSEVTDVTVITNTKDDIKMMIKDPNFLPCTAIVDPILTLSTPKNVTAATGIDALCHAIEAFISKKSQPLTDDFARSAIASITGNLRTAYHQPENVDAKEEMALASMQAGLAFSNASVTLVHGMSRPIGALFHVPHGVSNAMLLPAVLEFSKRDAVDQLAAIAQIIKPGLDKQDKEELADVAIEEIKKLCADLQIPNLKSWGVDQEAFEQVISKMATDALDSGSPGNNPRVPTHEEIMDLYRICYDYHFSLSSAMIQS